MNSAFKPKSHLWILAVFLAVTVNFAVGIHHLKSVEQHFNSIAHTIQVIGTIDDASEALQSSRISDSKAKINEALVLTVDNPAQQILFKQALAAFKGLPAAQMQIKRMLWQARHRERELMAERLKSRDESFQAALFAALVGGALNLLALALAAILIVISRRAETETKDTQAQFEAFMDFSPLRALMKDEEGRMLWMSKKYAEWYPQAKNWLGNSDFVGVPKEKMDIVRKSDLELLRTGTTQTDYSDYTYANNDRRDLMMVKFLLPSSKGRMIGQFTLDITEKMENERKLTAYAQDLENKNRELQNFASVAAHDLQEPLRKIETFGQMLHDELQGDTRPEVVDNLTRVRGAARRMRVLIEDLLSFTRISSRAEPFKRVELNSIFTQVLSDLEISIAESNAKISTDALPSIDADATQMRQLIQNLISNSLKYRLPDVAPEITIKVKLHPQKVDLTFSDNGIGFDPEYSDKIFELFRRLHGRNEYSGTGLGLAICRKIVERHRGQISAESQIGEGATFKVTLPLTQPKQGATS